MKWKKKCGKEILKILIYVKKYININILHQLTYIIIYKKNIHFTRKTIISHKNIHFTRLKIGFNNH